MINILNQVVRSGSWLMVLVLLLPPAAHAARRSADAASDDVPVQADPRGGEPEASTEDKPAQKTPINWVLLMPKVVTSCESSVHLKSCKYSWWAWLASPQCTITACAAGEYCFTPCLGQDVCVGGVPEGEPLIEQAQCLKPDLIVDTSCADSGATKTTVVVKGVQADVVQKCPPATPYCQNGACVAASQVTCLDSDNTQLVGGKYAQPGSGDLSAGKAGEVVAGGTVFKDKCKDFGGGALIFLLLEQACTSDNTAIELGVNCSTYGGGGPCVLNTNGQAYCKVDSDQDGIIDNTDNCPLIANTNQFDQDKDGAGDTCDNCLFTANKDQKDSDGDGFGDSCDNCPKVSNVVKIGLTIGQPDQDGDGVGDACDNCQAVKNANQQDSDGDTKGDECDNCPKVSNVDQGDSDGDGVGDVCPVSCIAANEMSYSADAISNDGRFVLFSSGATNLVPGDTNGWSDVFVRDRKTGITERVSVSSNGTQGMDNGSNDAKVSADGDVVAFSSGAANLVPGDTNDSGDIFVHDRQTGSTERVSVSSTGAQANGWSSYHAISADGHFVAFHSSATNLVPGDTNNSGDIFVHDRQTGSTERVSVSSTGAQANDWSHAPAISADGHFVAFRSFATNLVSGDTNNISDVFVRDRQAGSTERVSVSSTGAQMIGFILPEDSVDIHKVVISAGGQFVAFRSFATNLVPGDTNDSGDIFVHDRQTGSTERVSVSSTGAQANDWSLNPAFSADGHFVAFHSSATNLVPGDTNDFADLFVHDRQTGSTERVNVSSTGAQADSWSYNPVISAGGQFVAFRSFATNLVPGDTNDSADIFLRDRLTGKTEIISVGYSPNGPPQCFSVSP